MNAIKVTSDNFIKCIDIDFDNFDDIHDAVGSCFDIVRLGHLSDENGVFVFLCDDDGYAKNLPVNEFASMFYAGPPIKGDVVFCCESGPNLVGFYDIEHVFKYFSELLFFGCGVL